MELEKGVHLTNMKRQPISAQKGEIEFRKKLYYLQVLNKNTLNDEYDGGQIERILRRRMDKTYVQIKEIRNLNINLSPYIEIGAERCQRSLVMENDLGVKGGAAVDISFEMLRSCMYYKKIFKKKELPLRICADANNLPFMTGSVPFAFCYETIHHFPEPAPVIQEIYRVLVPGGFFFFDEEPFKQILHLNLYRGSKIYSRENFEKTMLRRLIDSLFCKKGSNEEDHGILENNRIGIKTWKEAINQFSEKDVKLRSWKNMEVDLFNPKSMLAYLAAYLAGGEIGGKCKKRGELKNSRGTIYDVLICPSCREFGREVKIKQNSLGYYCVDCGRKYPYVDKVLFLFSYSKLEELYPKIYEDCRSGNI